MKQLMRAAQNKKRSKAKSEKQTEKNARLIVEAHQEYLAVATQYLNKAQATLAVIREQGMTEAVMLLVWRRILKQWE